MSYWDGRNVTLYHGTTLPWASLIQGDGPDLSRSRKRLDFGAGFYTTTRVRQAIQWAWRTANTQSQPPVLVKWTVSYDDFQMCPAISFADGGISADDYWDFIALNRTTALPHRSLPVGYFDIVIGPVSNNFVNRTSIGDNDQISFHTPKGLGYLVAAASAVYSVRISPRPQAQGPTP